MRRLVVLAFALFPAVAFAQTQQPLPQAPPAVCIPASLANALHLLFGQGKANDDMLVEAAAQNMAGAVAAKAKSEQKVEDDATTAKAITDAVTKAKADQKAADAADAAKATAEPSAPATAAPKP